MTENEATKPLAASRGGCRAAPPRVWLVDLTYTQQTIAADVIPNAIGGIATFVETRLSLAEPIRLFKYPEKLAEALDADGIPDVVGFSNYIWNGSLAYAIAEVIKRRAPRTVIVFGGPNYPVDRDEQAQFLRARPCVDFYVVKEGELAFANLLEALVDTAMDIESVKRREIASVHALGADGSPRLTRSIERIRDLTEIPSPYATGRLDQFFDGMLQPIVQTNRGCPFSCTFCVEGVGYYNKIYRSAAEKVSAELDYIGKKMARLCEKGGRNDLFIADSNFGMYREDLDTCRELARTRKTYGWPEYINVATGKNQKERVLEATRIIDGALRLSGSVQSLDPEVLENIKRANISGEGLLDLAIRADELGANSYSEIILGLPGDSKAAHEKTIETVMDAGFNNIYLFQLMLLPGTSMCTPESRAEFGMIPRYRVLPRCYGHYTVLGESVVAAEVEEICVAIDTLSFADYLDCRRLHLIVTIFHNDGIFGSLLKLLRMLGVSVFRWMKLLAEAAPPDGLSELFEQFLTDTRGELWERREALEAFIQEPGVVEKFIDGVLGNNLLFVYKTRAITEHAAGLAELARATIGRALAETGTDTADNLAFVDDALAYHGSRVSNLFAKRDVVPEAKLRFDVRAFEDDRNAEPVQSYRYEKPRLVRFVLEESQNELIERYLGIYGDSPVGIGRILSKVYVRKLFRYPVEGDGGSIARQTENQYRIAGLQN